MGKIEALVSVEFNLSSGLDALLLDLGDLSDEDLAYRARQLYNEIYITSGKFGVRKTHDGENIKFWENRFRHAFCRSKDFRFSNAKDCIDRPRVERMAWIGEVVRGKVPNSACWLLTQNLLKRLYTVVPKGYVVWLEGKGEREWTFSTAYVTTPQTIHKYTRGAKRIWKYTE